MTFLPPPSQVIGHRVFGAGEEDAHGNVEKGWADPVDVLVHAWHTGQSEEPQVEGHERVRVDGQVIAPSTWMPDPRDRVTLPGVPGEFLIIGVPEDYDHGPFGWSPGVRMVNIQKVSG